jgi:hypothetical protein
MSVEKYKNINLKKVIDSIIDKLTYVEDTSPFKEYYINLKNITINNYYIVYSENINNTELSLKNTYTEYIKNEKYSTNILYPTYDIPVFFRKDNEVLDYLYTNTYYNKFKMNNIGVNTELYNPNIFDSTYGKYIITTTYSPLIKKDLVIYGIDDNTKKYYISLDFHFNKHLIHDMYDIFHEISNINSDYIVFNSLEVGSLPEVYHFHIGKVSVSDMSSFFLPTDEQLYSTVNKEYCFVNSYIFNLNYKQFLLDILPLFLYKLRKGSDEKKYMSQLIFFKKNNKEYLMISFRRVSLSNIILIDNKFHKAYYDEIFGNSYNDGITYLPLGIIKYKPKNIPNIINEITTKLMDVNIVDEFKKVFHHHPDFEVLLDEFIQNSYNPDNIIDKTKYPDTKYCVNLNNKDVLSSGLINCAKLPILYKLANIQITLDKLYNLENGKLLIDDSSYYYIKVGENDGMIIDFFDKYKILTNNECMLTIYKKIYNESDNCNYYLFNSVKTTFDEFFKLDILKFRDDYNMIHSIIVIIIYKFINMHKNNIKLKDIDINKIYVTDNNIILRDYYFDENIIVSISKDYNRDCVYKVFHYGNDYFFPFNYEKKIYSESELVKDIKIFINQFHHLLKPNNISNALLDNINSSLDNPNITIKDIYNQFSFMNDLTTCKSSKYEILKNLTLIYNLDSKLNESEKYIKIKEKLDNSGDFISKYTIFQADRNVDDNYFISGVSSSEKIENPYLTNELKPYIHINPLWFNEFSNLNDDYLTNLFNIYLRWNSTSKFLLYRLKPQKTSIIQFNNINWGGDIEDDLNFFINLINELYNLDVDSYNILAQMKNTRKSFDALTMLQELLNFGLGVKYPDIVDGYSIYINGDVNTEYVFINPQKSLSCECIGKLYISYFKIFFDYKSYLDDFNRLNDFEDYSDIFSFDDKKKILIKTINIIKTKDIFIKYDTKDDITFYNRHKQKPLIIDFKEIIPEIFIYGDRPHLNSNDRFLKKYLKYKTKYIKLKQNQSYTSI